MGLRLVLLPHLTCILNKFSGTIYMHMVAVLHNVVSTSAKPITTADIVSPHPVRYSIQPPNDYVTTMVCTAETFKLWQRFIKNGESMYGILYSVHITVM